MASDTQARINLTALQRKDPYIVNILDSATHVAVYIYNPTSGEWVCCTLVLSNYRCYSTLDLYIGCIFISHLKFKCEPVLML